MTKNNLPAQPELSIEELHDLELTRNYATFEEWSKQLARPVKKGWKSHPFIKVKVNGKTRSYRYLPEERIRQLLRYFFLGIYRIEVRDVKVAVNSICVTVRLHYFHPFLKEWLYHDGVAAGAFQMDKLPKDAERQIDLKYMKQSAVEMALPKAKTVALKNACKEFGAAFGAFLNKDVESYDFIGNELAVDATLNPSPSISSRIKQKADAI